MSRMFFGVLFSLAVIGCQSTDETASSPSACCEKAMALRDGIPACCTTGMAAGTGCCAKGMAESTSDAERPACCKQALAALGEMSPCCSEAMQGGDVAACCKPMMAGIGIDES